MSPAYVNMWPTRSATRCNHHWARRLAETKAQVSSHESAYARPLSDTTRANRIRAPETPDKRQNTRPPEYALRQRQYIVETAKLGQQTPANGCWERISCEFNVGWIHQELAQSRAIDLDYFHQNCLKSTQFLIKFS